MYLVFNLSENPVGTCFKELEDGTVVFVQAHSVHLLTVNKNIGATTYYSRYFFH